MFYVQEAIRRVPTVLLFNSEVMCVLDKLFTDSATSKVLDFVLDEPQLDYSKKEIARKAGVSWKTVDNILPELESFGLVVFSRRINKAQLYKVNSNSRVFNALKTLDFEISDTINERIISKANVKE